MTGFAGCRERLFPSLALLLVLRALAVLCAGTVLLRDPCPSKSCFDPALMSHGHGHCVTDMEAALYNETDWQT